VRVSVICILYDAPTVLHTNRPGRFCHVLCTARTVFGVVVITRTHLYTPTPIIIGVISTVTNFSFFPLLFTSSVVRSACASDPAPPLTFTPLWHFYTVVIHNDHRRPTAPLGYIIRIICRYKRQEYISIL